MLNEAYDALRYTRDLTTPLPQRRIDEIEVFAESVHAVTHEHDWRVLDSRANITNLNISVIFQCTGCKETTVREINRLDAII